MKKIKWENIIMMIIGGLYLQHIIGLEYDSLGLMLIQVSFLTVGFGIIHQMIKATRKGQTAKAIKELFMD